MYSPRQHSLAGARLSQDHYPGVARGRLLGKLEHGTNRGTLSHELRCTGRCQHAPERRVLAPQPAVLHRPREGLFDERRLHRSPQVVECAQLHGFDTVVVVRLAGEDHYLAGEASLAKTPKRSEPTDSRHSKVEQHHVERLFRDAFQRRLGVRGRFHDMPGPLEAVLHHEAERLLVIDNEYAHASVQCVTRPGAHRSTGSSNSTVVPLPTPALSARMLPPCCSMND